jgi:hypothetical protein
MTSLTSHRLTNLSGVVKQPLSDSSGLAWIVWKNDGLPYEC